MEIVTDLPKMYTMSQVAEILEVSRSKVSRLKLDTKSPPCRSGTLEGVT